MGMFRKASQPDDEWTQVCHLEDELVGRAHGSPSPAPAPLRQVLVGIDGRGGTEAVLAWAARLSQGGAAVCLASVGASGPHEDPMTGEMFLGQTRDPEATLQKAKARLETLGGKATTMALKGTPALALARGVASVQADLVLLGSPARGTGPAVPVGVSQNLKAMGHCTILVARQPPGSAIWAATDGSRPARHAVAFAYALSKSLRMPLTVVHSREAPHGPTPMPQLPAPVAGVSGKFVVGTRPERAILEALVYTPGVLLVVGNRGRTGGAMHTLGTVSDSLLGRSPNSIVVAQPPADPGAAAFF